MAQMSCRSTAGVVALLALAGWCCAADWETAAAAYRSGDYATAAQEFEALRDTGPALDAAASSMLGLCQLRLGATEDALANLRRAVDLDPTSARFRVALLQGLLTAGRSAEADEAAWAVDISLLQPTERTGLALLHAQALLELDEAEMASAVLRAQASEDDGSAALHRALGLALLQTGDAERAFSELSCAFALDPGSQEATARRAVQLARDQVRTDDPSMQPWRDRAASLAAVLAVITPTSGHLRLAGATAAEAGRLAEAVDWLTRARTSSPEDPAVAVELGMALVTLGRTSDGAAELRRALALEPEPETARRIHGQLARLLARDLRLGEAAEHFRLAGESARADEMTTIADAWSSSLARRQKLRSDLEEMRGMSRQLGALGDTAGVAAVEQRARELEHELAEIEANLARVRAAFADL